MVALLTTLIVSACGGSSAATTPAASATTAQATSALGLKPATMTPIKIAVAGGLGLGSLYWDAMVADAHGIFATNNLQPEFFTVQGGPDAVQAVVSGSADFGIGATDSIIRGIYKGAPISLIAGGAYPPHALVTASSITSYEQLKGKRVAVTSITAGSSLLLLELLKAHRLEQKDFEFVLSGSTPQRLAAITTGAVQGTVLSPPDDLIASKQGFQILGYVNEAAHFVFIGHTVGKSYAEKNRAVTVAYARSIRDANRFILDPANKAEVTAVLIKYTKVPQDQADATYDTVVATLHGFEKDATVTPEDLNGMIRIVASLDKVNGLKPETFIDNSYLQASRP